jgi:AraC family transcriptional regulator
MGACPACADGAPATDDIASMPHAPRHGHPLPGAHAGLAMSSWDRALVDHYIDERLGCDIGLDDLARLLQCSRQHFARRFKLTYAVSPYQYVIERRLERAKQLLRQTRLPLSEVAGACGFGDQSHFTTCFSCRVGVTPRRYRDAR